MDRFFHYGKWTRRDLNPRPPACKAGALPLSYGPKNFFLSLNSVLCFMKNKNIHKIILVLRLNFQKDKNKKGGDPAVGSPTATL